MEEMPASFLIPHSSFLVPRLMFPRASAGFMILAASVLPSALPAARVRNLLLCHRDLRLDLTQVDLWVYWTTSHAYALLWARWAMRTEKSIPEVLE